MSFIAALLLILGLSFTMSCYAQSNNNEVPNNAIENYLEEDMKNPPRLYIPNDGEIKSFKNSPTYKFFEFLNQPPTTDSPAEGCPYKKENLPAV